MLPELFQGVRRGCLPGREGGSRVPTAERSTPQANAFCKYLHRSDAKPIPRRIVYQASRADRARGERAGARAEAAEGGGSG